MYQNALIMMLFNSAAKTWHPIYYLENPFPGPIEDQTIVRYKSKGHHTAGFALRDEAVASANNLLKQLKEQHNLPIIEIESDLDWEGENIPADIQLRPLGYVQSKNFITS